jgi:hypothetical protein
MMQGDVVQLSCVLLGARRGQIHCFFFSFFWGFFLSLFRVFAAGVGRRRLGTYSS